MGTMFAAIGPGSERFAYEVMQDTWGHLAPGTEVYEGTILFAVSVFPGHGRTVIDFDFGDLDSSPWFYDGINDWLCDLDVEEGQVYRFTGTYQFTPSGNPRDDDHHEFVGDVEKVEL